MFLLGVGSFSKGHFSHHHLVEKQRPRASEHGNVWGFAMFSSLWEEYADFQGGRHPDQVFKLGFNIYIRDLSHDLDATRLPSSSIFDGPRGLPGTETNSHLNQVDVFREYYAAHGYALAG